MASTNAYAMYLKLPPAVRHYLLYPLRTVGATPPVASHEYTRSQPCQLGWRKTGPAHLARSGAAAPGQEHRQTPAGASPGRERMHRRARVILRLLLQELTHQDSLRPPVFARLQHAMALRGLPAIIPPRKNAKLWKESK